MRKIEVKLFTKSLITVISLIIAPKEKNAHFNKNFNLILDNIEKWEKITKFEEIQIDNQQDQWWKSFCSESNKKVEMWTSFFRLKMNYVNTNRINNLLSRYCIENTEENFKKLEHVIEKKDFTVYKQILYMIDKCKITEEDSVGIVIEINLSEHRTLLEV